MWANTEAQLNQKRNGKNLFDQKAVGGLERDIPMGRWSVSEYHRAVWKWK